MNKQVINDLANCFKEYFVEKPESDFISEWFRKKGRVYYFLFRKNLSVTNIQFAEIIALVKTFSSSSSGKIKIGHKLQFHSIQEFKFAIDEVVYSFISRGIKSNETVKETCNFLAKTYGEFFIHSIAIDNFYGSCALFVPPTIKVDLKKVCAHSGYIHSCGESVFIRSFDKFTEEKFNASFESYIKAKTGNKVFFTVYSHEDFTDYDREYSDDLKKGLDEVKVYLEKTYLGKVSLVSLLSNLGKKYPQNLFISNVNFNLHEKIRNNPANNIDKSVTCWLVIDYGIQPETYKRSDKKYFHCYEQLYINENPYYIFDENKPAWKSSTTLPHTLSAAMINIAVSEIEKIYKAGNQNVKIHDPFAGTGTIFLECLKNKIIDPTCSDIDPLLNILLRDNMYILSLSYNKLRDLHTKLKAEYNHMNMLLNDEDEVGNTEMNKSTGWKVYFDDNLKDFWKDLSKIKNKELNIRLYNSYFINKSDRIKRNLLFYTLARVKIKSYNLFERKSGSTEEVVEDIKKPFIKEFEKLKLQIYHLMKIRKYAELNEDEKFDHYIVYPGRYSNAITLNNSLIKKQFDQLLNKKDACIGGPKGSFKKLNYTDEFDIIITDPPYGFNVQHSLYELADFYREFIHTLVRMVKKNGQIVIALPDKSISGQISPFFTHKEIVLQQFFAEAELQNKTIVYSTDILPNRGLYRAPFYWESEKSLRRSILHLRFKAKS